MVKKLLLFTACFGLYLFSVVPFLDRAVLTNSPYDLLPSVYKDNLDPVSNFYPFNESILPSSNVTITLLVVPISFSDDALTISSNQIYQLFNGPGNSISNYFRDNSGGSVTFSSIVLPPTTVGNKTLYSEHTNNYITLPAEVGVYLSNYMELNIVTNAGLFSDRFDKNGDHFVDGIVFYPNTDVMRGEVFKCLEIVMISLLITSVFFTLRIFIYMILSIWEDIF
jgi:hypothetical protein